VGELVVILGMTVVVMMLVDMVDVVDRVVRVSVSTNLVVDGTGMVRVLV